MTRSVTVRTSTLPPVATYRGWCIERPPYMDAEGQLWTKVSDPYGGDDVDVMGGEQEARAFVDQAEADLAEDA